MTKLTPAEIENRVTYHPPTPSGAQRHEALSRGFSDLMNLVNEVCPEGRDKSITFTKLEDAKMRASAAVARDPETR